MYLLGRNCAVFFGCNIQEQVTAIADRISKDGDHFIGCFPIGILWLIPPVIINRHTQLPPVEFGPGYREVLFWGVIVSITLQAAIYNSIWLFLEYTPAYRCGFPLFCTMFPVAIKPPQIGLV